jgi:hypothetical protein
MDFAIGDILLCIDAEPTWGWKTKAQINKAYTYAGKSSKDSECVLIKEDPGVGYYAHRFIKLESITKLERILYGAE